VQVSTVPTVATAPGWVTYAALAVAAASLLVSGISLTFAARTYRRAGARVLPTFSWRSESDDVILEVAVINSGLAAIGVDRLRVAVGYMMVIRPIADLAEDDAYSGPRIPHRLDGNQTERWVFSLKEAASRPSDNEYFWNLIKRAAKLYFRTLSWSWIPFYSIVHFIAMRPGLVLVAELSNGIEVYSGPRSRALLHVYLNRKRLGLESIFG
jgi:hypothetical protein